MNAGDRSPTITPVSWLLARDVLGSEAGDFTPWLALPSSLQALGRALRLDDLTAVAQEHNVLGKRLDILATAGDENGDDIPVCIENQYGMSDADHLGRLIAYLAQQERDRAVWVVEEAHDAFVAAVRFLNRTSSEEVGYYLVLVRFTHGPNGSYQVFFDVLAAPIAWERPARRGHGSQPINTTKVAWMQALFHALEPDLLGAGYTSVGLHRRGSYVWSRLPTDVWLHAFGPRLLVRCTRQDQQVIVYSRAFSSREANSAAITIMEETYGTSLGDGLPEGTQLLWRSAANTGITEQVKAVRVGVGYHDGDPGEAASWAATVALLWLRLLREQPIKNMAAQVQAIVPAVVVGEGNGDDADEDD